jgi:hypothetical protein
VFDLSQPHTVVVVTATCRLPFARGRLGPGVYHFEGDQRKFIKTVYHRKQLRNATVYFLAGDTDEILAKIDEGIIEEVWDDEVEPPDQTSQPPNLPDPALVREAEEAAAKRLRVESSQPIDLADLGIADEAPVITPPEDKS